MFISMLQNSNPKILQAAQRAKQFMVTLVTRDMILLLRNVTYLYTSIWTQMRYANNELIRELCMLKGNTAFKLDKSR
jgi:hypothetical protein